MKIMGVDPSTVRIGWAVLDENDCIIDFGLIIAPKVPQWNVRIRKMALDLINGAVRLHQPDIIVIEEPDMQGAVGRMSGSMSMLMGCSYFIAGMLEMKGVNYEFVGPQLWKGGSIPKSVIYNRLKQKYGGSLPTGTISQPWNNDAVDAIGIARFYNVRSRKNERSF